MFRQSALRRFFSSVLNVSRPPASGYEVAELPNEGVLAEFMQFYKNKGVLVILHSGLTSTEAASKTATASKSPSAITQDPLTRSFISSINTVNLGHPEEVKLALVAGPKAPRLVEKYNVLAYPTTLLFMDGQCVYRCVGARTRELSIKSLFMLRNTGRRVLPK